MLRRSKLWAGGALVGIVGLGGCIAAAGPRPADPVEIPGVVLGWSAGACAAALLDVDRDGLDDGCEFALAVAFAPLLVVEKGGCGWDAAATQPRGGYAFAAQPTPDGTIRLAYLPAYAEDCGWDAPLCFMLAGACEGHAGDSELIAIDVASPGGSHWRTRAIFLSAHCFADRACRWFDAAELWRFAWLDDRIGGAPVIWVASGSNANYTSEAACSRGHYRLDSCRGRRVGVRFPIVSQAQNLGSRAVPFMGRSPTGCVTMAELGWTVGGSERECFWMDSPFRGFSGSEAGEPPTAYNQYLKRALVF